MAVTPIHQVEVVAEEVFPLCMSELSVCRACPFTVGVDVDVIKRWDESLYYEEFLTYGLTESFAEKYCKHDNNGDIIHLEEKG